MRVLVVEDDVRVAAALASALRREKYEVLHAASAAEALAAPSVDLILLDLGLPDRDGIELCRRLRMSAPDVAIIVVTARGEERDRIIGLRSGADDYIVKPYSFAELGARIEAVMRRARPRPKAAVEIGGLRVDLATHSVTKDGHPIALTRKEFSLLACLAHVPGILVSRERLLIEVWGTAWHGGGRTLDVHMATLRAKLGEPAVIETVRGVGYRLAGGVG
ncbi:response regulator transcription factor [Rhizohabitans arisaemae]|uniref:response regulator transcription factor n=1 Tax=Rhizohabitans arisaemae TaxID=2720610 RepID=UPI0024B23C55|nr:response regulator transcription factor [Rhizohabitans arisaemae]